MWHTFATIFYALYAKSDAFAWIASEGVGGQALGWRNALCTRVKT